MLVGVHLEFEAEDNHLLTEIRHFPDFQVVDVVGKSSPSVAPAIFFSSWGLACVSFLCLLCRFGAYLLTCVSEMCGCQTWAPVLDVMKPLQHKLIIERELEGFGIRVNTHPPNISVKLKACPSAKQCFIDDEIQ